MCIPATKTEGRFAVDCSSCRTLVCSCCTRLQLCFHGNLKRNELKFIYLFVQKSLTSIKYLLSSSAEHANEGCRHEIFRIDRLYVFQEIGLLTRT
ncbi:unnamed protein product [Larinioides sclopetarius]|uniref:B box-type domain-containing protein n=1 Tax=Larinioides sclopetarius TaxID=280406 RepID=A0AAV2BT36_9ARAC